MYLLDTHVLIWWMEGNSRLPKSVFRLISESECIVSVVSFWELGIKQRKKKIVLPKYFDEDVIALFKVLDIKFEHVRFQKSLVQLHDDPFDVMLISQSYHENLTFITADKRIQSYPSLKIIPL